MKTEPIAFIRRHHGLGEYAGWNVEADKPEWTWDRLNAAPVPLNILIEELNKIKTKELNVWAVVYPQES